MKTKFNCLDFKFYLILLIFFACFSSCKIQKNYSKHIIAVNGKGEALSPVGISSGKFNEEYTLEDQLNTLESELTNRLNEGSTDTVLIYIHGGLTSLRGGINENNALINRIKKINPTTFPLFINWEAGLLQSYGQHMFKVRQGELHPVLGPVSSWVVFGYDLLGAAVRLPNDAYYQLANDFNSAGIISVRRKRADASFNALVNDPNQKITLIKDESDDRSTYTKTLRTVKYIAWSPFRYTASLFFVDFLGTNSWGNMKRKTNIMFRPQVEFDRRPKTKDTISADNSKPEGVVYKTMEMVTKIQKKYPNVTVNLIGHSMGAIISNQIIQNSPDLKFNNIVYMGAACNIDDFEKTIIPYMQQNKNTNFYNLMLHPNRESREMYAGLTHAGSLLEWIDNYFERVSHFRERTLGKYENMMVAAHLLPQNIRDRVTLKTFGNVRGGDMPIKHGAFNDIDNVNYTFWEPAFWK